MKKSISSPVMPVILFLLFLIPAVSDAAYLIRLKNGGELTTPRYWVEGKQVYFYYGGGIAGIEKNSVRKIEKSTIDPDETYEVKKPEKRPAEVEPKPSMSNAPKIDKKEDTKKDPDLMQEFNKLEKKFESRKSMTIDELKDLWNELTAFWTKVRLNRLNEIFKDEVTEIFNMRDALDEILKSKGQ